MKIGIILESKLHAGGGFQQSLNAIRQAKELFEGIYEICVYYSHDENRIHLSKIGLASKKLTFGPIDRVMALIYQSRIGKRLGRKLGWMTRIERHLIADAVSLVYFLSPSSIAILLKKLNYIFTVWDVCHQDFPEFPEVRDNFEFEMREDVLDIAIRKAVLTLTDSIELSEKIKTRLGVDSSRLLPMPFSPAGHLFSGDNNQRGTENREILASYGLEPGYLFYPAQFWAHKNHIRIVQALKILSDEGRQYRAVFCGSDKGTMGHVEATAKKLGVCHLVRILDFIPDSHMRPLYENASALIMPTYFGPTNIPPLEAWSLGVPVIYSNHLKGQIEHAIIPVDSNCPHSISLAIASLEDSKIREALIEAGRSIAFDLQKIRANAEREFLKNMEDFAIKYSCWESA